MLLAAMLRWLPSRCPGNSSIITISFGLFRWRWPADARWLVTWIAADRVWDFGPGAHRAATALVHRFAAQQRAADEHPAGAFLNVADAGVRFGQLVKPNETLFCWCDEPQVYVLAYKRPPVTLLWKMHAIDGPMAQWLTTRSTRSARNQPAGLCARPVLGSRSRTIRSAGGSKRIIAMRAIRVNSSRFGCCDANRGRTHPRGVQFSIASPILRTCPVSGGAESWLCKFFSSGTRPANSATTRRRGTWATDLSDDIKSRSPCNRAGLGRVGRAGGLRSVGRAARPAMAAAPAAGRRSKHHSPGDL